VFIPVKRSQVAGLAVGWLAVALSMAAIGAAAVARVGVDSTGSQVQITVSRSTSQGKSVATLAPSSQSSVAISVPTQADLDTASLAQYAKPVTPARTSSTPASAKTSSAAPQPTPTSSATLPPLAAVPEIGVLAPDDAATTRATSTPSATKPGKGTTKHPSGGKTATGSGSATVVAVSFSAWRHAEGAIRAGCNGPSLAFVESKAGDGYEASQRASWFRTAITFDGPTTVSVGVSCSDGKPSFSILR
jgi:hypothetical protein